MSAGEIASTFAEPDWGVAAAVILSESPVPPPGGYELVAAMRLEARAAKLEREVVRRFGPSAELSKAVRLHRAAAALLREARARADRNSGPADG